MDKVYYESLSEAIERNKPDIYSTKKNMGPKWSARQYFI